MEWLGGPTGSTPKGYREELERFATVASRRAEPAFQRLVMLRLAELGG